MTFTVVRNSCTLYTFTVLRQKALAFTLPPPYGDNYDICATKCAIGPLSAGNNAKPDGRAL